MTEMTERYRQAEKMLSWNFSPTVKNATLDPHWVTDTCFWFKRDLQEGYEFILVDSQARSEEYLFDHQRLALVLTELLGRPCSANKLPIEALEYYSESQLILLIDPMTAQGGRAVVNLGFEAAALAKQRVYLNMEDYSCSLKTEKLAAIVEEDKSLSVISPSGKQEVIARDHNLYLRNRVTGSETTLTQDGECHHGYGNNPDHINIGLYNRQPQAPAVLWSPDGRYLAVQRVDERQVNDLPIMQSVPEDGSFRPKMHSYKMAMPGDTHIALISCCVIDLESGTISYSDRPPMPSNSRQSPASSMFGLIGIDNNARWTNDNCLYYVERTRGDHQAVCLIEFNPVTNTTRVLLEESGTGFFGPELYMLGPQIFEVRPANNEFIWYSRSSGWGHLYRYDLSTGTLKNAITSGEYVVTHIHHIDSTNGCLYFTAVGREPDRNPYYENLYRVNMDGSHLILLTPEPSNHDIAPSDYTGTGTQGTASDIHSISPDGKVFVDTISRVDQPSRSVLRSTIEGAELMTLSQCDPASLPNKIYPMPFTVKAADDITDLWGVLYRPGDFDESQCYPVILYIYGTPQFGITETKFAEQLPLTNMTHYQSLAEVGFVVVKLDPRGTTLRSKAFHDFAYGNGQSAGGIDDQVTALKQLGEIHAWMDMDRVGITGYSGGGYASARAMFTHPDFFKVAVSNAGSHDMRLYCSDWAEAVLGLKEGGSYDDSYNDNYDEQASVSLAKNLKGKLLLTHGDCDANVHVAHTMQLVEQLIRDNKDFDLLILPNRQHVYFDDPYFIRRCWDYFVEHLLKRSPPKNYQITSPKQ